MSDEHEYPDAGVNSWQVQAMYQQPSPLQSVITWVPVSERLPGNLPIGNLCLCYDADIQLLDLCVWLPELGKWHDGENCIEPDEYTHWAEAPTPPSEEK